LGGWDAYLFGIVRHVRRRMATAGLIASSVRRARESASVRAERTRLAPHDRECALLGLNAAEQLERFDQLVDPFADAAWVAARAVRAARFGREQAQVVSEGAGGLLVRALSNRALVGRLDEVRPSEASDALGVGGLVAQATVRLVWADPSVTRGGVCAAAVLTLGETGVACDAFREPEDFPERHTLRTVGVDPLAVIAIFNQRGTAVHGALLTRARDALRSPGRRAPTCRPPPPAGRGADHGREAAHRS
jgi:hypothetical protein